MSLLSTMKRLIAFVASRLRISIGLGNTAKEERKTEHSEDHSEDHSEESSEQLDSIGCCSFDTEIFRKTKRFKKITIHCSDTPNHIPLSVSTIRDWHLKRGFADVGYHFVINVDGTVQNGRPLTHTGAHVQGANEGNIGICLVGRNEFTDKQYSSLRGLCVALMGKYGITINDIYCHYEFPSAKKSWKTCPNIKKDALLERLGFTRSLA